MIYTKPITMKPIDRLESRVMKYLDKSGILRAAETTADQAIGQAFHIMPDLLTYIPELITAFEGHTVLGTAAYIMYNHTPGGPHKDATTAWARVNIPILNCEDTVTSFWHADQEEQPERIQQPNGLFFEWYDEGKLTLMATVTIDQPTIIRVREIHSVRLLSERRPRITLTLRLDPDPVHLLEN
jgi:hypothetical protein